MEHLPNENAIIVALARKILNIRLAVMPHASKREDFYMKWIRPFLVRFLASTKSGHAAAPPPPKVVSFEGVYRQSKDIKEILIIKCDHIGDFVFGPSSPFHFAERFSIGAIYVAMRIVERSLRQKNGAL